VLELNELLLHPGTTAEDLGAIIDALASLGDPEAVEGLATFVQRYHADESIAKESPALHSAAKLLLALADGDAEESARARTVLWAVADDPLCEPNLAAFIATGLRALPARRDGEATTMVATE
jgi:hypothetical protein